MIDPITCVPSAALTRPAATAAAEPLLEPPGVRARSQGLRVPQGLVAANSVVTVFPRITAPASCNAATAAASRSERQPSNKGEPICVAMSAVSIMSLTPIGMPSIADSGLPFSQRAVDVSAAARASSILIWTNAPIFGSQVASASRQRSRYARGVSSPEANCAVAARNGLVCGTGAVPGDNMVKPLPTSSRQPGAGSQSSRFAAGIDGRATDRMRFHAVLRDYAGAFPDRAPPAASC